MTVLTVGTNQQFNTIKAAVAASHDGDTIYVQAGTYVDDSAVVNHKISLIGVGGMVQMVSTKLVAQGGIIANTDLTVDHFEFSGYHSYNFNGAGIRYHGGNLTINNSYFHDNEDGVLGGPAAGADGTGSITITNSEFNHNGTPDGQAHNVYIGTVHDFTMTNSYSHNAVGGHEVKSRAENNTITGNRIDDENGTSSYDIDLPVSGNAYIANNIIRQGPNSPNRIIISYGAETNHPQWSDTNVVIENNTVINALASKANPLLFRNANLNSTVSVHDNTFFGLKATQLQTGPGTFTNNQLLATAPPAIDTSHPWTASSGPDNIVSIGIGDDVLQGTAHNDLFVGGVGQDTFVISPGGGNDVIADFNPGPGPHDVVQFVGTNFTSFSDVQAAMTQHGADVWLNLGKGEVLTFQNIDINSFASDDFTFVTGGAATSSLSSLSSLSSPVQVKLFTLPKTANATTTFTGTTGNDVLTGTSGNDSLNGGKGADTMTGGAGDDHYMIDNAGDVVVENPGGGTDMVHVAIANYTMAANVENMVTTGSIAHKVVGNSLNNMMSGGANDSLDGAAGNDILIATTGHVQFTGGAGSDIFQFSKITSGMSTVTDFTIGQDLLNVHGAMGTYKGADPIADGVLSLRSDGHGGTIFAVDPTHSGTMQDVVDIQNVAPTTFHMGYDYVF